MGRLVHLDSFVPDDGQSLFDLLPRTRREFYESQVRDGAVGAPPVEALGVTDPALLSRVAARLTPQPLRTFTEAVRLSGAARALPRDYVQCTEGPLVPTFAPFADRAKADPGWDHHELAAGHDAMLLAAGAVAAALLVGGAAP